MLSTILKQTESASCNSARITPSITTTELINPQVDCPGTDITFTPALSSSSFCDVTKNTFNSTVYNRLTANYVSFADIETCLCINSATANTAMKISLKKSITARTIILTSLNMTSSFTIETAPKPAKNSDPYVWEKQCCPSCPLVCINGVNDLGANSTFQYIQISWEQGDWIGICGIFAYPQQNYVIGSTITSALPSPDSNSYLPLNFKEDGTFIGSLSTQYSPYSTKESTCVYQKGIFNPSDNDSTHPTQYSLIVIDFPFPMVITEVHSLSFGIYKQDDGSWRTPDGFLNIWFVDPVSQANTDTVANITKESMDNQGLNKAYYTNAISNITQFTFKNNNVNTAQCTDTVCSDWGITRIILANDGQWYDSDFVSCGIAVMGYPVTCPPTTTQCKHSKLNGVSPNIDDISIVMGQTFITDSWTFPDTLNTLCTTPPTSVAACSKSHTLICVSCSACLGSLGPSSCSGTCGDTSDYTPPTFTNSIQGSLEKYTLKVVSPGSIRTINHRCMIKATMNAGTTNQQIQYSNQFLVREACEICNTTIVSTDAWNYPNFTLISVGDIGQTQYFSSFSDTVTKSGCDEDCYLYNIYTPVCRQKLISGEFLANDPNNPWEWIPQITAGKTSATFKAVSTKPSMHGITWQCMIQVINTESNSAANSSIFELTFDICKTPSQSCQYDPWQSYNSEIFTLPPDISVFLNNVPVTTTFDYSTWKDEYQKICGSPVCGNITWSYVNGSGVNGPIIFPYTQSNPATDKQSFTVKTTNANLVWNEDYRIKIIGTLNNTGIWSGTQTNVSACCFKITIVDPCKQASPCIYTSIIDSTTNMNDMTAYLDNIPINQGFTFFQDTVTNTPACNITCTGQEYSLKFFNGSGDVPSDLASLQLDVTATSIYPQVIVATRNYNYTGAIQVYIRCSIPFADGTETFGVGDPFWINIVACNTKSCVSTQFIPLGTQSTDIQPQNYSIGISNIANTTEFTKFRNTVGEACTTNHLICGTPSYTLVYANGTSPGFMQSIYTYVGGISTTMAQASYTNNLSYVGKHVVRVKAKLDLTSYGGTSISDYTKYFTISVDPCDPLPCSYNKIYLPPLGSTMPENMAVTTNGTAGIQYFSQYQDEVSLRCYYLFSTTYQDLCGQKIYTVENNATNVSLSFGYTTTSSSPPYLITFSTTDILLIDYYVVRIHAAFQTPTLYGSASDETSYTFSLVVDRPDPCIYLNCRVNQIINNTAEYLWPSDFTIDVSTGLWNLTYFDNFNDSKTQNCIGKSGSQTDGTIVANWTRPVCPYPIYELVDAHTLKSVKDIFGSSNIFIGFDQQTNYTQRWFVQAKTTLKTLVGNHQVKLSIKLNSAAAPIYSSWFTITVKDPCNPYDCTITEFAPIKYGLLPNDIIINFGEGYVFSQQGLWSNSVNDKCVTTKLICGYPKFELLLDDSTPVPFQYIIQQTSSTINVGVIITNETMMGQTYQVYLNGYGQDYFGNAYGQNGTSKIFQVKVGSKASKAQYSVSDSGFSFFEFPGNSEFQIGSPDQTFMARAIPTSTAGIESVDVKLYNSVSFVTLTIDKNRAIFQVNLNQNISVGVYKIDVQATDKNGTQIQDTFTITVLPAKVVQNITTNVTKSKSNFTQPLKAAIVSISITGQMKISYNRRVMPVTNLTALNANEFNVTFEQLSDEALVRFNFKVLNMTPAYVFVQLIFDQPLLVSQGDILDRVHVTMLRDLFMVEDILGVFKDWKEGDSIRLANYDMDAFRQYSSNLDMNNLTFYEKLQRGVPQQVKDLLEQTDLEKSIRRFANILEALFYGPFALYVVGFGQMELVWVIFNNLQIISCVTQFNLKLPVNLKFLTQSYSEIANLMLLPVDDLYYKYRDLASNSKTPDINIWGQNLTEKANWKPKSSDSDDKRSNRLLQDFDEKIENQAQIGFESSRFAGQGSSEFVLITYAQMILFLTVVGLLAFIGLVFWYTVLHWLPEKVKKAFHWLRMKLFWNLTLRVMIQQYMCVTMATLLNLKFQNKQDTLEQKVNFVMCIMILILYSLGFIVYIAVFLYRNRYNLQNEEIQKQFGTLILSIEISKKWAVPMVAFSLLRKLLLILVAIILDFNLLQIISALYIQQSYTCYVLMFWPMQELRRDLLEIFNEVAVFSVVLMLCPLTDYLPDPTIRYSIGWAVIYIIFFQVGVNSILLLLEIYHHLQRLYKIIHYHREMKRRAKAAARHNKVVDKLQSHKDYDQIKDMKKANPYDEQQKQIESSYDILSEKDSSGASATQNNNGLVIKRTISQRKREFQKIMEELAKTEVKQDTMLTVSAAGGRAGVEEENQIEISFEDDGAKMEKKVKLQEAEKNLFLKAQEGNDWPVSPRQAKILAEKSNKLPPIHVKKGVNAQKWFYDDQESKASDWNALPSNYQNLERNSNSFVLDSSLDSQNKIQQQKQQQKKQKSRIVWNSQLELSVPDANQNSADQSKWKEEDSVLQSQTLSLKQSEKNKVQQVNKTSEDKVSHKSSVKYSMSFDEKQPENDK